MDAARPKSHTGDYNIKRRFGKGFRNSKKNIMVFANRKKEEQSNESFEKYMSTTPHRSCSLNALHTGQDLLQPRMAQLETLEAKMARIENSLSTTPRKKKISTSNGSITSVLIGATNANLSNIINGDVSLNQTNVESKSNSLKSISTYSKLSLNGNNTPVYKASGDLAREMNTLKNALKDKENVNDSLKGQLHTSSNMNRLSTSYLQSKHKTEHTSPDKQVVEERLEKLKQEMDNKRLLIKNIKLELERLDITDNIDVRIQQAELEYQLGREELNLLSILEEIQSMKTCLEECETAIQQNESATVFNFTQRKTAVTLHSIEIIYDPKSPRFGTTISEDGNGLCIEWSAEDSELIKGDRLLEINGKITFNLKNREDMIRLLSVSPNPAQIVVLRQNGRKEQTTVMSTLQEELKAYREKAGEAERIRDSFRSDNVRLTHRISYLEEQVAELLSKISKNEITPTKHSAEFVFKERKSEPKIQIFQKGSKVTVIGSVDSEKKISKAEHDIPIICNKMRSKSESKLILDGASTKNEKNIASYSGRSDTNSIHLLTPTSSRESTTQIYSTDTPKKKTDSTTRLNIKYSPDSENSRNQHLNIINISSNNYDTKNKENYYNLMNERRIKYIKDAQNSLLTCGTRSFNEYNNHKPFRDDRSCKSVDFDSEPNYQSLKNIYNGRVKMYDSETSSDYSRTMKYPRPIPPQKPLRLSLHKGCSLQSVKIIDKSSNNDSSTSKKYPRRSHKSEICINSNKEDEIDNGENRNKYAEKWC